MKERPTRTSFACGMAIIAVSIVGCASSSATVRETASVKLDVEPAVIDEIAQSDTRIVQASSELPVSTTEIGSQSALVIPQPVFAHSLNELEILAVDQNPRLVKLYQDYHAASSRAMYVDELPDPKLGASVFGAPIQTASGSQRAILSASQLIPWLGKLNAEEQRASFNAFAVRADYMAERLRVIAAVRTGWYRLYVIDKQIETAKANQELLKALIEVANAQIATGTATQGDVLLGTLELTKLEERLLTYAKLRIAIQAEVNRLVARDADIPVTVVENLQIKLPSLNSQAVYQSALESQPEIQAAQLRTQATRWGIEVAHLSRRPELTVSAKYFFTDNNRPASTVVDVGEDPWSLGAQVSIPLWKEKYDALEDEATWNHLASTNSETEILDRYDARITELLAEAKRAEETADLYKNTILPQAQQTLRADQESYSRGAVEFDRVIRDYRNLLTLELGYHQAVGELAISLTRLSQVIGQDLSMNNSPALPALPIEN